MFENLRYKTNSRDLSEIELQKLMSFLLHLSRNKSKIRLAFRGDNYNNLRDKLNLNGDDDYSKLNDFLFLIGEKGRTYQNEFRNQILNRKKVYSINSVEIELFKNIFVKLNKIFTKKSKNTEVELFNKTNSEFFEYFSDKKNKDDFIHKINSIENESDKLKVRDYYLMLLHRIGKIGFYNNSFFISMTTKFDVAKQFSNNNTNSNRIIIVSWVSYSMHRGGINPINSAQIIESLGLPIYEQSFYPRQKEISVKGGLLPHYILGYIIVETNEFIVNPNFFQTERPFEDIVLNGFAIDQTNFHRALSETDYCGFFMENEDGELHDEINETSP